jgi:hypothetical protein
MDSLCDKDKEMISLKQTIKEWGVMQRRLYIDVFFLSSIT